MHTIILIALAILLAGCNDPKSANEKNFGKAIQKYLETVYPKCYLKVGLPTTIATSNPNPTYSTKPLLAFVSAGLVSENEVSRRDIPMWGVIVEKSYDLTAQGKKFYTPNISQTIGGKPIGAFCLGKGSLKAISQFSEPVNMMGLRVSQVRYTYVVSGMPEWAKSQKFSDALPALKADADSHARPAEAIATLILTSDGWIHEELFRKKSASHTGPTVSRSERTKANENNCNGEDSTSGCGGNSNKGASANSGGWFSNFGQKLKNSIIGGNFKTDAEMDAWGAGLQVAMLDGTDNQYLNDHPMYGATKTVLEAGAGAYAVKTAVGAGDAAAASLAKAQAVESLAGVPGRVLSRINITTDGMQHVVERHLAGKANASQFSISEGQLRGLLQSKLVVNTPVTRLVESADGVRYLRQVNVGTNIGFDKFARSATSTMTVLSDRFGNLVTAFPGALK